MFIKINYISSYDLKPTDEIDVITHRDIEDILQKGILINSDYIAGILPVLSYQGYSVAEDVLYRVESESYKLLIDSNEYKRLSQILAINSLLDIIGFTNGAANDEK